VGTIKFVRPEEAEWIDRSTYDDDPRQIIPRTNRSKVHLPGSESEPHLFEPGFAANTGAAPHAHGVDEVFHIIEGEMKFGRRTYPVGSTIFIPAYTLYSFEAGDEGCRFLNFRPRRDASTFTRQELAEHIRGQRG
jgi:mannose-6-phosphate isomerase-like protein (cupin superfamily)